MENSKKDLKGLVLVDSISEFCQDDVMAIRLSKRAIKQIEYALNIKKTNSMDLENGVSFVIQDYDADFLVLDEHSEVSFEDAIEIKDKEKMIKICQLNTNEYDYCVEIRMLNNGFFVYAEFDSDFSEHQRAFYTDIIQYSELF